MSLDLDSPYQISKVVGEFYSVYYHRAHGLPTVAARFQNVYGPGEILGAGRWRGTPATVWRNVTPTFVYRALQGPAAASSTTAASRRRDFIYVGDIVRRPDRLRRPRGEPGDVYNLASGVETTIRELAELINELGGNPTPIELAPAARLGPLGPALRQHREGASASSASRRDRAGRRDSARRSRGLGRTRP